MSVTIKRIQSQESGTWKKDDGRNRANFYVPATTGFLDLQNSEIVMRMNLTCTSNGGHSMVVPIQFGNETYSADAGGAQVLIRNASVASKDHGLLNEQRQQNVVNNCLQYYEKSTARSKAERVFRGLSGYDNDHLTDNMQFSPFITYSRPTAYDTEVNVDSEVHQAEMRLPLSHVDRFADGIRQFPSVAVGDLTYRVELEDVNDVISVRNTQPEQVLANVTASGSVIGSSDAPLQVTTGWTGDFNLKLKECPFYVHEPLSVNYIDASAVSKNHVSDIASLNVNSTTDALEIVLTNPAPTSGATDAVTTITASMYIDSNIAIEYEIDEMYLELHQLNLLPSQLEKALKAMDSVELDWLDYRLTKKNMNSTTHYSETLMLDPNCAGLAVITPHDNYIDCGFGNATSYRFSIDGKNVTNRDVDVGKQHETAMSLHNHLVQKFFGNLEKAVRRLSRPSRNYTEFNDNTTHGFYPLVTPIVPRDQIVNIQIRSSVAMDAKEVYYLAIYPKALKFHDGRLAS